MPDSAPPAAAVSLSPSPAEADGLPTPRRWWAAIAVWLAISMTVLDSAIANVALPTIAHDFGAAPSESIWIVNAYQLAIVIALLPLAALGEIVEEYRLEMNKRLEISDAEILTARPLQDQERAKLEREVAVLAGTRVNATFLEDKSLIGGAIVRIGSTIYDGSVRGRLERLRERLVSS